MLTTFIDTQNISEPNPEPIGDPIPPESQPIETPPDHPHPTPDPVEIPPPPKPPHPKKLDI